jgi:hypothetical protein
MVDFFKQLFNSFVKKGIKNKKIHKKLKEHI